MNAKTMEVLQEYDQWLAERREMANRELDTPSPADHDQWAYSDDDGLQLFARLVAALRGEGEPDDFDRAGTNQPVEV